MVRKKNNTRAEASGDYACGENKGEKKKKEKAPAGFRLNEIVYNRGFLQCV